MKTESIRRLTGLLLVVVPVVFTLCFTLLQVQFEYPDILRQPTDDVLRKFQAGGSGLIATWYVLTLTALLFVPLAVMLHQVLAQTNPAAYLWIASAFGVIAGLVQTLGFVRWPFLVPHLASIYLTPTTSMAERAAAAIVFEAFHRYAGVALGEHLGFLCTALWTSLIALALRSSPQFKPWISPVGVLLAVGIALGLLEPAGWELAGTINTISYLLWAIWLMVVGVMLLRGRAELTSGSAQPVAAR